MAVIPDGAPSRAVQLEWETSPSDPGATSAPIADEITAIKSTQTRRRIFDGLPFDPGDVDLNSVTFLSFQRTKRQKPGRRRTMYNVADPWSDPEASDYSNF
jgi:hypothetical protein